MSKLIVAVLTLLLGPAIAYATETYTVTEAGFGDLFPATRLALLSRRF
jgi:hypothetical protein